MVVSSRAGDLDVIGASVLRQIDPTLLGDGVYVAQPEATDLGQTNFEVNPTAVNQTAARFAWISDAGTSTTFPNTVGTESGHADGVGWNFYGVSGGVAPNVVHVDNYEAGHFYDKVVWPGLNTSARVVNQSFIFSTNNESTVNPKYDNYAAQFGTLFVSGVGNGDVPVSPPATSFNGIGVGVYGANSSAGPTSDGRCKPDITAPGGATSFSTPYVAGSAAVLLQAANRGDGGTNSNAAADLRTLKALLLNGAIKPADWTNGPSTPLDARYGAGIVNVCNSWTQLKGGKRPFIETTSSTNGAHPPGGNTNNEPVMSGWDTNSISTSSSETRANHYYFRLAGSHPFVLTATLVWNRQQGQSAINNLDLFLYDVSTSNVVIASTSLVDNVEHVFVPALRPGRYDLQVLKRGSPTQVSPAEAYALAFEIFNTTLSISVTNDQVLLSWPDSPTGFRLQSTANLDPPIQWTTVNAPVLVDTNKGQNLVLLPVGGANEFFRLTRP